MKGMGGRVEEQGAVYIAKATRAGHAKAKAAGQSAARN